jgi:omega-6 fatty acid desaturase (delta-12 desaturase)
MRFSTATILAIQATITSAFAPVSSPRRSALLVRNVATNPEQIMSESLKKEGGSLGAMVDLDGIAFSSLKGKALSLTHEDFPKANEIRSVIPKDCFEPETAISMGYLGVSAAGTTLCTLIGVNMLNVIPATLATSPIWAAYAAVTGTVAMGLWVLAHECGHGAFSKNRNLQDIVGYVIHSAMLVPYFSWQRSHAVHHQYTNHIELGETHVPELVPDKAADMGSLGQRKWFLDTFGEENGLAGWGVYQLFMHLVVGWPGYLLIGATGGTARGMTNHFWPSPLTEPDMPNKELFPGNWREKVWQSDIGIAAVLGALFAWVSTAGWGPMMALYGGPLLVVNAWLVTYTWLQHTDVDVPHFDIDNHNYVKGALHTIDRAYDKMDPWGLIDFLHHKIGTTHVAHHFDSSIPHYKAQAATDAIAESFPHLYLKEDTPIHKVLWRLARGCTGVVKRGDRWVFDNTGLVDKL